MELDAGAERGLVGATALKVRDADVWEVHNAEAGGADAAAPISFFHEEVVAGVEPAGELDGATRDEHDSTDDALDIEGGVGVGVYLADATPEGAVEEFAGEGGELAIGGLG